MTGYEIRNAMKRAYGIDAAEHLFETHDDEREDRGTLLIRMLTLIALAMKGAV